MKVNCIETPHNFKRTQENSLFKQFREQSVQSSNSIQRFSNIRKRTQLIFSPKGNKFRFSKKTLKQEETNFKKDLSSTNASIRNKKKIMFSTAKTQKEILMEKNMPKIKTCKSIGDKQSYYDQFLQNPQILKNYNIMSHIGRGCFSVVSLAIEKTTKKPFAIKTYEKINSLDWHQLQNIKKQIKNLYSLSHKNIIQLLYVVKERKKIYLIMENGGKQSLSGLLRKIKTFTQVDAKLYFKQILSGIQQIHEKGICHRDIKPENILIGDEKKIKIIDLGFSASNKTSLITYCGTPPYMCPEIVTKKPYNGGKADIWALGVMLFVMLVGKFPFRASSEQQLYRLIQNGKYSFRDHCVSAEAKDFIGRMLRFKAEERASAKQLLNHKWFNQ